MELVKKDDLKEKEESVVKSLKGYGEKKAVALVKDTYKADMLKDWAAAEDRPNVKRAISDQLEELKPKKDKTA
jgi:DNA polymerase/3'-5' exonuclease PolX